MMIFRTVFLIVSNRKFVLSFSQLVSNQLKILHRNGCEDFKLETRRDILKRSGQNDDMPDDMKKLKECKIKTRQKIRKEVEKCVQTPLGSDFQLGAETPIDYSDFPIDTV